jgi:ribosome biogenesis protein Nip4
MENKYFVIEYNTEWFYGEIGTIIMNVVFFGNYEECKNYVNKNQYNNFTYGNDGLYVVKFGEKLEINY